jgi:CheY-like chemotaxis protein
VGEFLRTISQIGTGSRPDFPERNFLLAQPLHTTHLKTLSHSSAVFAAPLHRIQRMAVDLLNGKQPGERRLRGALIGEPMLGETMLGEAMSGETVLGETRIVETISTDTMAAVAFAATRQGGPKTILLVEDEAFVRKVTAEVLQSAGYKLVVAGGAGEALAYRGRLAPPDLLLADVIMPGMSGRELAVELTSFYPSTRVLLMSGYAEQLTDRELPSYGGEYLAKPFSIHTLLSRIREVLDKPVHAEGCSNPCSSSDNAWLAESHEESGIAAPPCRGFPSPHTREACRRPHNSPRPGLL